MSAFGERLRDARLRAGLKQKQVAEKLGCASTSVTNWENGKVLPSMEVLDKLCGLYGISPVSLLSGLYIFDDLVAVAKKPVSERSYEDTVALAFSSEVLDSMAAKNAEEGMTESQQYQLNFIQLMEWRVRNYTGERGVIWMLDTMLSDDGFYTMFKELIQASEKRQTLGGDMKQYYDWKIQHIVEEYFMKFAKNLGEEKNENIYKRTGRKRSPRQDLRSDSGCSRD